MNFRQAEEYLLSLELFGMRFGLDRMHRLMTVLGLPQRRFASIHVVGSNGKSSTVRFAAAILEREGLRTGSYTSPHLRSFRERIEVGEEQVSEADFAAAVTRAAQAAELVNRTADPDDHVTQFEALTAAAYHELARRGVEVAVIEAGLGGRFDATNVIPSKVQVLTSVSLEHTRWLGPTLTDIAGEKLAVVHDYGTLVVGPLPHAVFAIAQGVAADHHTRLLAASPTQLPLRASGRFQEMNFGIAAAAAEAFLGRPVDEGALRAAASETVVPGRLEAVAQHPLVLLDGAHNPSGATALAASLPDVFGPRRPRVAVVGVLEDKDAAGMLETLLPHVDRVVFTRPGEPALALAGDSGHAVREARRSPRGDGRSSAGGARAGARAGGSRGRRARHRVDLPDRRSGARGRRRAGVDPVVPLRVVHAVLFDLDGVLVESREATERVWMSWARDDGIGEEELRSAMHGVRSVEVVRALRPNSDFVSEAAGIEEAQAVDTEGLRAIRGAPAALSALREDRIAVVTSATRRLAAARLAAAGIEPPAVMITAEEVTRGKPDPEGYLAAARRLGVDPAAALVVEDTARRASRRAARRARRWWG